MKGRKRGPKLKVKMRKECPEDSKYWRVQTRPRSCLQESELERIKDKSKISHVRVDRSIPYTGPDLYAP